MRYILFCIAISLFSFSVFANEQSVITVEQEERIHTELRGIKRHDADRDECAGYRRYFSECC